MTERDYYHTPETRVLLRTEDVYQTEQADDVASYSDTLLSVVADCKNSGEPQGVNARSMVGKSKRGEVACQLFARIDPATGIIEAAGFKTRGCLAVTGCASAACQLIEGKGVEEALLLSADDIKAFVDGVPSDKVHSLHYVACAVKGLVGDFLVREGAALDELDEAVPCDDGSISCIMAEHCSLREARAEKREAEWQEACACAEANACAEAFDLVRQRTAAGLLTCAADWRELVPTHLMPGEFDELVLSYVPEVEDGAAEVSTRAVACEGSPSPFANRGVGIPKMMRTAENAEPAEMPETPRAFEYDSAPEDDEDFELTPPEGYELVCIDGEWGLVATDAPHAVPMRTPDAAGIVRLEGAERTYLYDSTTMLPEFAQWAFLAAEDDPQFTFAYCVRQDSRVYPRPMAQECFTNAPFHMTPEAVESIWQDVQALPDYADLARTEASNGDVYYFSTRYLEPEHAQSLAEWASVERFMNV